MPGVLQAILLAVLAIAVLYSLWILIVSLAFYVVKVDNLTYLFTSIFDAARWPATVFRGVLHLVFTFVIPLALMTTSNWRLGVPTLLWFAGYALLIRFFIPRSELWTRSKYLK